MTETERHVEKVIDGKAHRDKVLIVLAVLIVLTMLGVVMNAYYAEQRARSAEQSAVDLAQQVTLACADPDSTLLVGDEDVCAQARDVAADPVPAEPSGGLLQGPPGEPGATGATGPRGLGGLDGLDGLDGSTGSDGTDGADGKDGVGVNGKDGANGSNGVNGKDGAAGADGLPGSAGADGKNGVDGAPGKDGAEGPAGPAGSAGADGKDGAEGTPGRGITGASCTGGVLVITYTDGTADEINAIACLP